MKRCIVLLLAGCMLSGCATMTDEQTTTAQGAGLGAALGAIAGGIIGHQSGYGVEGALIGGLVGAAAGGVYGDHVAQRKASFASEEDYLNACITQAEEVHRLAAAYNDGLRTEVADLETRSIDMMAAYQGQSEERQQLLAMQQALAQKLEQAQQNLAAVSQEIAVQQQVLETEKSSAGREQIAQLENQIRLLEEQKAELTVHTDRLAAINNRISV